MNNLSENLKKIRKDNNLSQEQLADELGVSRQAISKWESGAAYPEMEKLVQICQKFDVNIDDLLNKDIREVKGEEDSKKKLNNYIDDFLGFISDTVNMFCSMSFKSKVKCLFEQFVLIIILSVIFFVIGAIVSSIFDSLVGAIFGGISWRITDLLLGIYLVLAVIISSVVLIHIFKIRYLDYYMEVKKNNNLDVNSNDDKDNDKKSSKIEFKNDNDKIVIRDPKHSEYRFINGFFKVIIFFIKFFALMFALSLCFCLICCIFVFVVSFMFIKTKLLFIGFVLGLLSLSVATIVVILLLFNFIFDRKNDKKKMIFTFIASVIVFGVGCGFAFISLLDFNVVDYNDKSIITTKTKEIDMDEDLFFIDDSSFTYIEKDINNVVIEYDINKFYTLDYVGYSFDYDYLHINNGYHLYSTCTNSMDAIRYFIDEVNKHNIVNMNGEMSNIKVYANHDNLAKINSNKLKFEETAKTRENIYRSYDDQIEELYDSIEEKDEEISDLYDKISEKDEKLEEYKSELEERKEEINNLKDQINSLGE